MTVRKSTVAWTGEDTVFVFEPDHLPRGPGGRGATGSDEGLEFAAQEALGKSGRQLRAGLARLPEDLQGRLRDLLSARRGPGRLAAPDEGTHLVHGSTVAEETFGGNSGMPALKRVALTATSRAAAAAASIVRSMSFSLWASDTKATS